VINMAETKEKGARMGWPELTKMYEDRRRELEEHLKTLLQQITNDDLPVILTDPALAIRAHKATIGLGMVLEAKRNYNSSPQEFISYLKAMAPEIGRYDRPLENEIRQLKSIEQNEAILLLKLHSMLRVKSEETISGYFRNELSHEVESGNSPLMESIRRVPDVALANRIARLVQVISSIENAYLREQLKELREMNKADLKPGNQNAPHIRENLFVYVQHLEQELQAKYRINDAILVRKLKTVLDMQRKYDNVEKEIVLLDEFILQLEKWLAEFSSETGTTSQYVQLLFNYVNRVKALLSGLLQQFKDNVLAEDLKKDQTIRKLLFYVDKYRYLGPGTYVDRRDGKTKMGLQALIAKGYQQNDWKDFLAVARNAKAESQYIIKQFADQKVADKIVEIRQRHRDDIQAWMKEIESVIAAEVNNKEKVLEAFSQGVQGLRNLFLSRKKQLMLISNNVEKSIEEILQSRINILEKDMVEGIVTMRALVEERLSSSKRQVESFLERVDAREKKFIATWKPIAKKLELMLIDGWFGMGEFRKKFDAMPKGDWVPSLQRISSDFSLAGKWQAYAGQLMGATTSQNEYHDAAIVARVQIEAYRNIKLIADDIGGQFGKMYRNLQNKFAMIEDLVALLQKIEVHFASVGENVRKLVQEHFDVEKLTELLVEMEKSAKVNEQAGNAWQQGGINTPGTMEKIIPESVAKANEIAKKPPIGPSPQIEGSKVIQQK